MAGTADATRLTDTDVLIDASRRVPVAMAYVTEAIAAGTLVISIVTAMELIQGCRDQVALAQVRRLLRSATVLPVDGNVSQSAHARCLLSSSQMLSRTAGRRRKLSLDR